MNTPWIITAFAVGGLLGGFYFGTLWLTVRRLASTTQPALLLLASTAVRMSVVLLCFYVITNGRWERLLACLLGFMLARAFFVRRIGKVEQSDAGDATSMTVRRTTP